MATQFRHLGPGDAEVFAAKLQAWHLLEGVTLDATLLRRETQRLLADSRGWHAWMIESPSGAIGYLMVQFRTVRALEPPRAYVSALYLVPAARQFQVGAQAHRFLTELGRWLQVKLFEFDTARENKHAHLFARCASRAGPWNEASSMQATA